MTTSAISVVYSLRKATSSCGLIPSEIDVKPCRSEKKSVTSRRSPPSARRVGVREDLLDDLRRDVAREGPGDEALVLALGLVAPDRGADQREQDRRADRPQIEEPAGAIGGGQAPATAARDDAAAAAAAPAATGSKSDGGGDERGRREREAARRRPAAPARGNRR